VGRGKRMGELEVEASKKFHMEMYAVRIKIKGRARGGIITRMQKGIEEINGI